MVCRGRSELFRSSPVKTEVSFTYSSKEVKKVVRYVQLELKRGIPAGSTHLGVLRNYMHFMEVLQMGQASYQN